MIEQIIEQLDDLLSQNSALLEKTSGDTIRLYLEGKEEGLLMAIETIERIEEVRK